MSNENRSTSRWVRWMRTGPVIMTLGALLVLAGIVQTTSSTHGGNQGCPDGTVLIAKYNNDGGYSYEKPAGNENVVTLTNTSNSGGTWTSSQAVSALIVHGGPASTLITFTPPQYTGTFTNTVLPKVGNDKNYPTVSNLQFCGGGSGSTTTTGPPSSTSSTTPNTCQCSTSTSSTSTTTSPSTTTSSTTTTTIREEPATSLAPTTTTTHPATTTTTTQPGTTTTTSGEEPATSLAPTTTEVVAPATTIAGSTTTLEGQGSTTTTKPGSVVTSTSVLPSQGGTELPFTGGSSLPLMAVGIVLLGTGLALTLSSARRRNRARA